MLSETAYLGSDNTIDLLLKADDEAQDLSSVTRMTLTLDAVVIDSDTSPAAFDWTTGVTGKLILALGDESIEVGTYRPYLIVYDPTNTDGIVWDVFELIVKQV